MTAVDVDTQVQFSFSVSGASLLPVTNSPFEHSFDDTNDAEAGVGRLAAPAPRLSVGQAFELLDMQYGDLMRRLAD